MDSRPALPPHATTESAQSPPALSLRRPKLRPPSLLVLVLLVICWTTPAPAQSTVLVSVKHILMANGQRSTGQYTADAEVHDVIAEANTVLSVNGASFRLAVSEISNVANSTFQTMTLNEVWTLESTAIANATQYKWRSNAINLYIIPNLVGAGGACSYPAAHQIIVISNNGILNGGIGWLHEIGHFLSLTHTFSQGNASCPSTNPCDPTVGSIHATGSVPCPDICPDTNNVMSYNCLFSPGSAELSPCQLTQMDFELYAPNGSRSHIVQPCNQALLDFQCAPDCASSGVELSWVFGSGSLAYLYRGNGLLATSTGTSYVDHPGLGTHNYRLVSNGCELTCVVTVTTTPSNADNLIWRLGSPSNYDSAALLHTALLSNGESVDISNTRAPFTCATAGQRIWVMAGTRPNAGQLTWQDGQFLRDAILNGVHVYVEGPDLWGFDPATPFNDYDGIDDTTALDGDNTLSGLTGFDVGLAQLQDMSATYDDAAPGNDSTDRIQPTTESIGGASATTWTSDGANSYGVGTYYATPPGFGKVLCQTWEFGGYTGNRAELARRYSAALGGGGATRAFAVSGSALGIPFQFGFGGANPVPLEISGLFPGSGPHVISGAFINAINVAAANGEAPGLSAHVSPFDNKQFVVESASGDFEFHVSTIAGIPCEVTNNPTGCTFNPTLVEVAPPVIPRFIRGDTNGDGARNLADAVALLSYLFPNGSTTQIACIDTADANDLGQVNLSDAITILNALFGNPPVPVAPPVGCGEDPTPDSLGCDSYSFCP